MPKKSTAKRAAEAAEIVASTADAKPEKGSDAHLLQVTGEIITLLIELRDPYLIQRALATVDTFFPSKLRVEPSRNGVENMP